MNHSLRISKNVLMFGFVYAVFILSEQVTKDTSFIGQISQFVDGIKIKYLLVVFAIILMLLQYTKKGKKQKRFFGETSWILKAVGVLSVITILLQLKNGFKLFAYEEIFFMLIPILYVYLLVNNTNKDVMQYINAAFVVQYIFFLINISSNFSLEKILQINFINSYSPFESEFSFYGVVFFCTYLFVKDKVRSILSLIMVILAFKRMAVVFCLLILAISLINKKNWLKQTPKKTTVNIIILVFIIVPLVYHFVCTDTFTSWFYSLTGLNFNTFISGRLTRVEICLNNELKYGLGSTNELLNTFLFNAEKERNLHNDILRIYLECGLIGTIGFTIGYFNITRKSNMSLLLMTYLFVDMIFNHFLGAGRTAFWMIIFLSIYLYNSVSHDGEHSNEKFRRSFTMSK